MLIAPQFLLFSFIIFCAILLYRHIKLRSQLVNVPSPRSWMLFGHVLIIKPDMEGFIDQLMGMAQLYPQHPRMTLFWFGTIPTLMIYSARLVESLFSNNNHINKGMFYDMFRPWLGNGLLTKFFLNFLD